MLEQNRNWLKQSNKKLLDNYKEQETKPPSCEHGGLRVLRISHEGKKDHLPPSYISPVYYQRQNEVIKSVKDKEATGEKRFCIVAGTDGGHLLNHVLKNNAIKHMVVIEPDMDSFYNSLRVVNWPAIFTDFHERGGTVFFHIGQVTPEIKNKITTHILDIGPYNAANLYMHHDDTNGGRIALVAVVQCLQGSINTLGFYDDERVGFTHSIEKLKDSARILMHQSRPWIDKPVMVCGNGSSLTGLLPQIRKCRNRMFLVACGTTIGTFYREGIVPDFYIEQERPLCTSNWTKLTTTQEFRDKTTCIGLNVVHPQTNGMFKDVAYVLKSNDLGGIVLKEYLQTPPQLLFVNPLVANAGTSIMTALGFRHIYLAGIDCAFAPDGGSHAKGHKPPKDNRDHITIPGNFRKEVTTTQLYLDSARTIEGLIRSNPDTKYYNLCDGAYIKGAKPTKKFLPISAKPITKEQIMANFKPAEVKPDTDDIKKTFTMSMYGLKLVIDSIPEKISGKDEAFSFIDAIRDKLAQTKQKSPMFWYLIKGSLTTQLCFLATCADCDMDAFDKSSAILKEFASKVHDQIKGGFYEFDDYGDNGFMPEDVNAS